MGASNSQYGKGGQMPPGYVDTRGNSWLQGMAQNAPTGGSWQPGFYGQNTDYFSGQGQPMTGKGGGGGKAGGTPAPYTGQGMFNFPGGGSQYPWPQPGGMWWQGNRGQGIYAPPPAPGAPPAGAAPGTPATAPPVWEPPPPGGAVGGSAGQGGATKMPTVTPGHAWAPEGFNMDNPADWERIQKPGATTTTADGKIIWTPEPGHTPPAATTTPPPPIDQTVAGKTGIKEPGTTTPPAGTVPAGAPLSPVDQAKANGITDPKMLQLIASGYLDPTGNPAPQLNKK